MEDKLIHISSLIGDPIRILILWNLLDGKTYTATELAICVNTSPQNVSIHLRKLIQAELLQVERYGRNRYYRLAKQDVAYAIEAIANLIPSKAGKKEPYPNIDADIRYCRICYDHLAGEIGVRFTDNLFSQNLISITDKRYEVTKKGNKVFADFGIEMEALKKQRRLFAHACLDWSERKYHLAGALGASLLNRMILLDWVRRKKDSRAFIVTGKGEKELYEVFRFQV